GFYITRHPLAKHEPLLRACATATTADLARFEDGREVVLGGMVTNLRTVVARSGRNAGRRMGILTLEDLSGRVEAVLFPDDLATHQSTVVPDAIVFLEGAVDRRREEPSLRVSNVVPLDRAVEAFSKEVFLNLSSDQAIDPLVKLLQAHRGRCPVYLNVPTADGMIAQIECGASFRVGCAPEFVRATIDLVGLSAVCLLAGPNRPKIPLADY
ncbi:MAG: hypothetical protein IIB60_01685, partial [Planctomycetes bacterium]|nr:hypothetical protein [Planctomycetota bacterium]